MRGRNSPVTLPSIDVSSPIGSFLLPDGFCRPQRGPRRWPARCSTVAEGARLVRRTPRRSRAPRGERRTPRPTGSLRTTRCCWCRASWPVTAPCAAMSPYLRGRGLPHLPRPDPRQRRLHPRGRRPARAPAGVDRDPPRPQGHHRRATASAGCSPAGWPPAGPTWSRASSRWAARCWPRAPSTALLAWDAELLAELTRAGVRGLMSEDCVGGECARLSWEESQAPLDPGVGVHRDLQPARRHRRLARLPRPGGHARRGAHQPLRDGRRPGGDGPRARPRCASSSSGGPAGSGRQLRAARWVRSASLAGDRAAHLDGSRDQALERRRRRSADPSGRRRGRVELGQRGGHEGVARADRVDDLDLTRQRARPRGPSTNAVAPCGPAGQQHQLGALAGQQRRGPRRRDPCPGASSSASSSLSLTRVQRAPSDRDVAARCRSRSVEEGLPQVGVVADEDLARAACSTRSSTLARPGSSAVPREPTCSARQRRQLLARQGPLQVELVARAAAGRRGGRSRWRCARRARRYGDELDVAAGEVARRSCAPRSSSPTWVISGRRARRGGRVRPPR